MGSSAEASQALLDQGLEAERTGRFGAAGQHLLMALELIESWPDGPERSEQLRCTANRCIRAGHPDLALMAIQGLLESREHMCKPAQHCADLFSLAKCWNMLGRPAAATAVNEAALAHALERRQYGSAASASTNLAMNDLDEGRMQPSLRRLQASLEFLTKDPNPDTDAITRMVLLRVVDEMQTDPAIALDAAVDLFTRLQPHFGPERWKFAEPAFHRLVDRYISARPELDAVAWKRETFPLVFGDGPT
jgi:hypothetical protein